jgi:hypothetical protein
VGTPRQLTPEEQAHVRTALHYLHARLGTWIATARAVRIKRATLRRVRAGSRVKLYLAQKVAKLAAVPVDDLRSGKYPPAVTCHRCGCPRIV